MNSRIADLLTTFAVICGGAFAGFLMVAIVHEAQGKDGRLAFEVGTGSGMAACGLMIGAGLAEGRYKRKYGALR